MTIVETTSGRVRGGRDDSVLRFQAIPYSAPPVGELRFKHPVAHKGWTGVRDATTRGPSSLQAGPADKPVRGQEDCLYLNVCTPGVIGALRPTMVWFHGGGFTNGAGWLAESDPVKLATRGEVVVVSCNYRLGALGWMHLGDLDDDFGATGNCGLFDQLAVLRWTHENIERFGGDPDNVTAFGQSAGATGLVTLATMPESHGLMHRAIAQSAALSAVLSVDDAREMTDYVLDDLAVTDARGLLAVSPERILEAQQRAVNRLALATASQLARQRLGPFGPVLDGRTIATSPLDALRSGGARTMPLIAGANRDEWRYFGTRIGTPDEATIVERLADWLPEPESLWAFYRARAETSEDAWIELQTDRLFRVPTVRLIEAWGSQSADLTYHYDFRWQPPGSDAGATHSREIPFVFDTFHHARGQMLGGPSPARSLIDFMQTSWIEFARSGAPAVASQTTWPAYGSARRTAVLDAEPSVVPDLDRDVRQIWDGALNGG